MLTPGIAVVWAAVLAIFFAAYLLGTGVASTVGSGFVNVHLVTPSVLLAGLTGAILWDLLTWYLALPTSSSHALIGGYAGAAFAKAGFAGLVAGKWGIRLAFIIRSPRIGLVAAMLLMVSVYWGFKRFTPSQMDRHFPALSASSRLAPVSVARTGPTMHKRRRASSRLFLSRAGCRRPFMFLPG